MAREIEPSAVRRIWNNAMRNAAEIAEEPLGRRVEKLSAEMGISEREATQRVIAAKIRDAMLDSGS